MNADGITLVVDRRNLSLRLENKTLRLDFLDGSFQRVPVSMLANVMVYGNPSIRCNVWRALADANVPVAILPGRGRGDVCWLGSGLASYTHIRQQQYNAYQNVARRLSIARWLVMQKLAAQSALLARLPSFANVAISKLDQLQFDLSQANKIDELLGYEGHGAAVYYDELKNHVAEPWGFKQRNRRPPRDPANALLSLGYTLTLAIVGAEIKAAGLDPYLGFLHDTAPARPSLALDLLEPLRAGVDLWVMSLLKDQLTPDNFTYHEEDGCRLDKAGRVLFYANWSQYIECWLLAPPLLILPTVAANDSDIKSASTRSLKQICRAMTQHFITKLDLKLEP